MTIFTTCESCYFSKINKFLKYSLNLMVKFKPKINRNNRERTFLNIIARLMYSNYDIDRTLYRHDSVGVLISDHDLYPNCTIAHSEFFNQFKEDMKHSLNKRVKMSNITLVAYKCESCGRSNRIDRSKNKTTSFNCKNCDEPIPITNLPEDIIENPESVYRNGFVFEDHIDSEPSPFGIGTIKNENTKINQRKYYFMNSLIDCGVIRKINITYIAYRSKACPTTKTLYQLNTQKEIAGKIYFWIHNYERQYLFSNKIFEQSDYGKLVNPNGAIQIETLIENIRKIFLSKYLYNKQELTQKEYDLLNSDIYNYKKMLNKTKSLPKKHQSQSINLHKIYDTRNLLDELLSCYTYYELRSKLSKLSDEQKNIPIKKLKKFNIQDNTLTLWKETGYIHIKDDIISLNRDFLSNKDLIY